MSSQQATAASESLALPDKAACALQQVPYKGSLPTAVPTDPLIYRLYEIINVYGATIEAGSGRACTPQDSRRTR